MIMQGGDKFTRIHGLQITYEVRNAWNALLSQVYSSLVVENGSGLK
jgi:hypothetical protein